MAKQRPSAAKRQREQQKRQRELKKAERAAQKRERRLHNDRQDAGAPPEGADVEPGPESENTGPVG